MRVSVARRARYLRRTIAVTGQSSASACKIWSALLLYSAGSPHANVGTIAMRSRAQNKPLPGGNTDTTIQNDAFAFGLSLPPLLMHALPAAPLLLCAAQPPVSSDL